MASDWPNLIGAARARRPAAIKATCFVEQLKPGGWKPVVLGVEGSGEFATKGLWRPGIPTHNDLPPGRGIFNDHLAGRLGRLTGAPVPEVAQIDVPQDLIDKHPETMGHLRAGIAHGSRIIKDGSIPQPKHRMRLPIELHNRSRFALLAILFGWANGSEGAPINDAEFLYTPDGTVHSIDFGNFFGGPDWEDLRQLEEFAVPNIWIVGQCALTQQELVDGLSTLATVTPEQIAGAIAAAPDEWGVTLNEAIQLVSRLYVRQRQLLGL